MKRLILFVLLALTFGAVAQPPTPQRKIRPQDLDATLRDVLYIGSSYSSVAGAVSAAGGADKTLIISTALETANHDTIPANITLDFRSGGALSNASGTDTVYIFGHVQAPPRQIFPTDVKVYWATINGNTNAQRGYGLNDKFYAEWWGAAGDSSTNSTTALQEAINASISRGVPVQLLDGYYLIDTTLVINSWLEMWGNGEGKTYVKLAAASNADMVHMKAGGSAYLRDIVFNGDKANQTGAWRGFLFRDVTSMLTKLERVRVEQTSSWCVEIDTSALIAFEGGNYTQSDSGGFYIHGTPHVSLRDLHSENHAAGSFAAVKIVNNLSTAGAVIQNCHFEGQLATKYLLYIDGDGVVVTGNDFNHLNGTRPAIYISANSERNVFTGNNITNADSAMVVDGNYNIFHGFRSGTPSTTRNTGISLLGKQNQFWYEGYLYGTTDFRVSNADTVRFANTEIRRVSGNSFIEATVGRLDMESVSNIRLLPGNGRVYLTSLDWFEEISDTLCWIRNGADTTRIAPPRP